MKTKLLYCWLIAFFLGFALGVFIGEAKAEVNLSFTQNSSTSGAHTQDDWHGLQLSVGHERYGFLSAERFNNVPGDVWATNRIGLIGLGLGKQFHVSKGIRLYGQAGVFKVGSDREGRLSECEGCGYYLNMKFAGTINGPAAQHFEAYELFMPDYVFGGEAGAIFDWSESLSFLFGYRVMKLDILVRGIQNVEAYEATGTCWETENDIDLSGFKVGLNWRF